MRGARADRAPCSANDAIAPAPSETSWPRVDGSSRAATASACARARVARQPLTALVASLPGMYPPVSSPPYPVVLAIELAAALVARDVQRLARLTVADRRDAMRALVPGHPGYDALFAPDGWRARAAAGYIAAARRAVTVRGQARRALACFHRFDDGDVAVFVLRDDDPPERWGCEDLVKMPGAVFDAFGPTL